MKLINNWYWPNSDQKSHLANHTKMLEDLKKVLGFTSQRRTCVQAGGAVGVWPQFLSNYFEKVYTFEVNPHQFECLEANVTAPNVTKYNCALGQKEGHLGFIHDKERCNASYVTSQAKNIPCYTLDSFGFTNVDFICLDLEGYELFALKGAKNILQNQTPLVQVENKHYNRYGLSKNDIKNYMQSLGYRLIYTYKYDEVYQKE